MNEEPQGSGLPELSFKEVLKKAWDLLIRRPGVYVLSALMFVLPASLMVNIQGALLPENVSELPPEDLMRLMLPTLLWSVIAFLFEMVGFMVISVYVMRSSFSTEKENFGDMSDQDFMSYLTIAFKAFPRSLLTQLVLLVTLFLMVFFFATIVSFSPLMAFFALIPAVLVLFVFLMYRYGAIVMSVRVRAFSYQLAIGSQAVLREKFWKSFGWFMLVFLMTMLPGFAIRALLSLLLDQIRNPILLVAAATLIDTVVSVLEMYLVTFMSVRIHHALKYALSD